ncbi:STAS domain-containing protein [Streptomyces sp. NPDC002328]|uniref:STAS domain-containing protein n=1 Tax=Streptomyces sp. NPDC002328 TaxID=3364642 RepID=UPI00369FF531
MTTLLITKVVREGRAAVLTMAGEVDLESASRLRAALQECLTGAPQEVRVDLSGVSFFDCSGLNVLLETRASVAANSNG